MSQPPHLYLLLHTSPRHISTTLLKFLGSIIPRVYPTKILRYNFGPTFFFHSILISYYEKCKFEKKKIQKSLPRMGISIKMIQFCLAQAFMAVVRRVELQIQFPSCETLLRSPRTLNGRVSMKHVLACHVIRT